MRLALLIETDGPGGAERMVADLAAHFQASGSQSVVFLPRKGEGWLGRQLAGSGVVLEHFDLPAPISPACARGIAEKFRRHRIDVAHSHEFSMAVYGAWAATRAGIPHVITMHGSRYYADRPQRRLALRAAIAASRHTVAVSHTLADQIAADLWVPRRQIAMVPNGVSFTPPQQTRLRQELGLTYDDRLIVAVGNLYPVKGHEYLIDALSTVVAGQPRAHVAIAGRGELEPALRARARERNVADRLHLLGLRSDIPAVLKAADLFVQPSLSEGLPLAMLEAMSAGLPVVATDVGEVGAVLAEGAGIVVPPADVSALATAITRLLDDPHAMRTLGAAARSRATSQHSISAMARRYNAVYQRLLTRRRKPVPQAALAAAARR